MATGRGGAGWGSAGGRQIWKTPPVFAIKNPAVFFVPGKPFSWGDGNVWAFFSLVSPVNWQPRFLFDQEVPEK